MKGVFNMIKLGLVLGAFATAACVMLAFVYDGTSAIIREREEAAIRAALADIFADIRDFKPVSGITSPDPSVTIESATLVMLQDGTTGMALQASKGGYEGPITMMVGVSADGTIAGVKILKHTETPGLGDNAGSPSYFVDRPRRITFYGQFAGKNVSDPFEVKNDVVAITASTITSRAVATSVKAAGVAAMAWLEGVEADAISSATEGGAE
jgi:electron transport complex protein RnfG